MPRLRDRPLPFRRKVPGLVLLRLRGHAGRPDPRRGAQMDGRSPARHDRRELIEASGAMVGGEMERSTVKFGPTAASEMEKIAEKLREAEAQGETVANRLDELRKEILGLEETIKDIGGRSGAFEVKTSTLEAKRKEFAAKLASADKDLAARKGR